MGCFVVCMGRDELYATMVLLYVHVCRHMTMVINVTYTPTTHHPEHITLPKPGTLHGYSRIPIPAVGTHGGSLSAILHLPAPQTA